MNKTNVDELYEQLGTSKNLNGMGVWGKGHDHL